MDRPLLERYEILEEIGRGGMGRVVRARDLSLLRLVAIKIVPAGNDPNYIERLTREARATALLSHPNIVAVYEMGQMDDSAFIVMEYVTGHTLRRVCAACLPRNGEDLSRCWRSVRARSTMHTEKGSSTATSNLPTS